MTENDLLNGLRTGTLPTATFHHRQHLHAAWLYLERWGLARTLTRFSADLHALATAHGAPDLFHATITWAFLFAVDARRRALPKGHSWDDLARQFPELFERTAFLGRYYCDAMLSSELARRAFVLPDRLAAPTSRRSPSRLRSRQRARRSCTHEAVGATMLEESTE